MNLHHSENIKYYNNNVEKKLKDENNQNCNMYSPYRTNLFIYHTISNMFRPTWPSSRYLQE